MNTLIMAATALPLFTGAPSEDRHSRIETAVIEGASDRLLAARARLKAELHATPTSTTTGYLLGYVGWRLANSLRGKSEQEEAVRQEVLEEAVAALETVVEREPKDAEARALLASVLGQQIGGSMFRAMRLGRRSSELLGRARALDPKNPRVALLNGIRAFYTPSMFGGGADVAQRHLDRAHTLFAAQLKTARWPNWGRIDVFAWRGQLAAKRGDKAGARALYERALQEQPNAAWIRYVLLPAVR